MPDAFCWVCRVTGLRPRLVTLLLADTEPEATEVELRRTWEDGCAEPDEAEELLRTVEDEELLREDEVVALLPDVLREADPVVLLRVWLEVLFRVWPAEEAEEEPLVPEVVLRRT